MHIADATMFHSPRSGGVRSYLEAKRRWLLCHTGHRHTLVVPGARLESQGDTLRIPAPALPFGHGYRFPLRPTGWAACLAAIRPDLIEAGDPYVPAWGALEAGERLGVPVIAFYHSDVTRLVSTRLGSWSSRLAGRYVRNLYARFARVLAPSRVIAERLEALGLCNVRHQPLGVDLERFSPARADFRLRGELGLSPDTRLLVFVGRCSREKNIRRLTAAMEHLGPGYHLLLAGPDMPPVGAANCTVESACLSHEKIARLLGGADAFVHPGDRETFGLVILEAMACGLPVVGVNAGAVPELIRPGTGVLAPSPHPAELAEAVRTLFSMDVAAMGMRARRTAEARWGWDTAFRRLLAVYAELTTTAAPERIRCGPG